MSAGLLRIPEKQDKYYINVVKADFYYIYVV